MMHSVSIRLIVGFLIILLMISCVQRSGSEQKNRVPVRHTEQPVKIGLIAFRGTDTAMVSGMLQDLKKEWTPEIELLPAVTEPASAWYKPRKRWIADSLLVFLNRMNNGHYLKVAGISSHDISTRKGDVSNWGVMGLGFCPGGACVVSSFRAKPGAKDARAFRLRMRSLLFHELGHTFGLPHCPVPGCIMEDAKGKMTLDGEKSFCNACRKRLQDMGLLR